MRGVDRVDGVRPQRIGRRAYRQQRVGASGQVPGRGVDVGLQHRVEPAAGVRVEVALRVAQERPELAAVGVERGPDAVQHVQAEPRRRVLVLLRVEQANCQVDLLPKEGRGPEPSTAEALVRGLNLKALREDGVADVQALEPGIDLVGDDLLPGDARRLECGSALAEGGLLAEAPLLEPGKLLGRGQIAVGRPVLRRLGGGSGLAHIHGAELLDRDGVSGGVRRVGHPERQTAVPAAATKARRTKDWCNWSSPPNSECFEATRRRRVGQCHAS